jgi:hypothetical protein
MAKARLSIYLDPEDAQRIRDAAQPSGWLTKCPCRRSWAS